VTPDQLTAGIVLNSQIERIDEVIEKVENLATYGWQASIVKDIGYGHIPEEVERAIRRDVLQHLRAHRDDMLDRFETL
jgi:hypothetical protein